MTPLEVIAYARQQYNAVNDSFFSDAELYTHVWHAQSRLAKEKLVENTYETDTVADQQEYTFPTSVIALKRIAWDGKRLTPITFKEDDWLTGFDADTTSAGTPTHYAVFDRVIYLRPTPSAAYTLKLFTFDEPAEVSATSTLDVPEEFHLDLANFVLWKMALKDQNFQAADYYKREWQGDDGESGAVSRARQWTRRRATADGFRVVRDEDAIAPTWWEGGA